MPIAPNDPRLEGYVPIETVIAGDDDSSSLVIRDVTEGALDECGCDSNMPPRLQLRENPEKRYELQSKYADEPAVLWKKLIDLAALRGIDGKTADWRFSGGWVQIKRDSTQPDTAFVNLYQPQKGDPGLTAYQVAVSAGYPGSLGQWLASLVGPEGPKGERGFTGPAPVVAIGNVTTLAPGMQATAAVRETGPGAYAVDLGIPAGRDGEDGDGGPIVESVLKVDLCAGNGPFKAYTNMAIAPVRRDCWISKTKSPFLFARVGSDLSATNMDLRLYYWPPAGGSVSIGVLHVSVNGPTATFTSAITPGTNPMIPAGSVITLHTEDSDTTFKSYAVALEFELSPDP